VSRVSPNAASASTCKGTRAWEGANAACFHTGVCLALEPCYLRPRRCPHGQSPTRPSQRARPQPPYIHACVIPLVPPLSSPPARGPGSQTAAQGSGAIAGWRTAMHRPSGLSAPSPCASALSPPAIGREQQENKDRLLLLSCRLLSLLFRHPGLPRRTARAGARVQRWAKRAFFLSWPGRGGARWEDAEQGWG